MSAETTDHAAADQDARMGRAVIRGIQIALPSAFVFLTLAVWLITDLSLGQSFATAALPSVLLGGFAGGFAGVAATM
ncbi:MAG TPA: hypothetical protein EYP73_02660 [Acidimicrobiia bacterium]|nr:hypothetical protein [Acidimicrobiia bacterium]